MKREAILMTLAALLAVMFFYAACSKLIDMPLTRFQMHGQVFPKNLADVLAWLVPLTELMITLSLLLSPTRLLGFYASLSLLLLFSIYIAITMSGAFGKIPCSCGGVLGNLGYWTHLVFNLGFMFLAGLGIAIEQRWMMSGVSNRSKERRPVKIS